MEIFFKTLLQFFEKFPIKRYNVRFLLINIQKGTIGNNYNFFTEIVITNSSDFPQIWPYPQPPLRIAFYNASVTQRETPQCWENV